MNTATIVRPEEIRSPSIQVEIIRQIQINNGQAPCYATSATDYCDKKECGWRSDCFDDAREAG
ncbi:MAG: hypothetical protein HYS19_00070 [Nitrosomonadales bacterium]|nr:hypothetical protein [Nitrosomonadales bacterium]